MVAPEHGGAEMVDVEDDPTDTELATAKSFMSFVMGSPAAAKEFMPAGVKRLAAAELADKAKRPA